MRKHSDIDLYFFYHLLTLNQGVINCRRTIENLFKEVFTQITDLPIQVEMTSKESGLRNTRSASAPNFKVPWKQEKSCL